MITLIEAVATIEGRFQSGNAVPVQRAYMTRAEWDAFCDVIRQLTSDYDGWTPTSKNLNALPEPVRKYIHDLHATTDQAVLVRENVLLRDEVKRLAALVQELTDERS